MLKSWLTVPEELLQQGETELWSVPANRSLARRAVGGALTATNQRLMFRPHRFDRATGAGVWSIALDEIAAVGVEPRTWNPLDGGLRKRLRVELPGGAAELFVVSRLPHIRGQLEQVLAQRR